MAEGAAMVDQDISDTKKGLREENWVDKNYFVALLQAAQNASGRKRAALIAEARRIWQSDTLTRYYMNPLNAASNRWAHDLMNEENQ